MSSCCIGELTANSRGNGSPQRRREHRGGTENLELPGTSSLAGGPKRRQVGALQRLELLVYICDLVAVRGAEGEDGANGEDPGGEQRVAALHTFP